MEQPHEDPWKQKKRHEVFPWMKDVVEEFSKSFPNVEKSNALQVLHKNVENEFEAFYINRDHERAGKLCILLSTFLMNFCWKLRWKQDQMMVKVNIEDETDWKKCITKTLCYLIYLGLSLRQSEAKLNFFAKLFPIIKLFPDKVIVYDALLLIKKIGKTEAFRFHLLLRHVLCKEICLSPSEPTEYVKILLLLKRLKRFSKGSEREKVAHMATKVKQPPHLLSWLSSCNEHFCGLVGNRAVEMVLSDDLEKKVLKALQKKVLGKEFTTWISKLLQLKKRVSSLSIKNQNKSSVNSKASSSLNECADDETEKMKLKSLLVSSTSCVPKTVKKRRRKKKKKALQNSGDMKKCKGKWDSQFKKKVKEPETSNDTAETSSGLINGQMECCEIESKTQQSMVTDSSKSSIQGSCGISEMNSASSAVASPSDQAGKDPLEADAVCEPENQVFVPHFKDAVCETDNQVIVPHFKDAACETDNQVIFSPFKDAVYNTEKQVDVPHFKDAASEPKNQTIIPRFKGFACEPKNQIVPDFKDAATSMEMISEQLEEKGCQTDGILLNILPDMTCGQYFEKNSESTNNGGNENNFTCNENVLDGYAVECNGLTRTELEDFCQSLERTDDPEILPPTQRNNIGQNSTGTLNSSNSVPTLHQHHTAASCVNMPCHDAEVPEIIDVYDKVCSCKKCSNVRHLLCRNNHEVGCHMQVPQNCSSRMQRNVFSTNSIDQNILRNLQNGSFKIVHKNMLGDWNPTDCSSDASNQSTPLYRDGFCICRNHLNENFSDFAQNINCSCQTVSQKDCRYHNVPNINNTAQVCCHFKNLSNCDKTFKHIENSSIPCKSSVCSKRFYPCCSDLPHQQQSKCSCRRNKSGPWSATPNGDTNKPVTVYNIVCLAPESEHSSNSVPVEGCLTHTEASHKKTSENIFLTANETQNSDETTISPFRASMLTNSSQCINFPQGLFHNQKYPEKFKKLSPQEIFHVSPENVQCQGPVNPLFGNYNKTPPETVSFQGNSNKPTENLGTKSSFCKNTPSPISRIKIINAYSTRHGSVVHSSCNVNPGNDCDQMEAVDDEDRLSTSLDNVPALSRYLDDLRASSGDRTIAEDCNKSPKNVSQSNDSTNHNTNRYFTRHGSVMHSNSVNPDNNCDEMDATDDVDRLSTSLLDNVPALSSYLDNHHNSREDRTIAKDCNTSPKNVSQSNASTNQNTYAPRNSLNDFVTDTGSFHSPDSSDCESFGESLPTAKKNTPHEVPKKNIVKPSKFSIYSSGLSSELSSDDFVSPKKRKISKSPVQVTGKDGTTKKRKKLFNPNTNYFLRVRSSLSKPKRLQC